ncbi:alpha/beta hydrolase [Candidatus Micrarchaeota archaeon]|nr:alpha/beta hydrolase [Candidatus Micrarchaeota archaeon]
MVKPLKIRVNHRGAPIGIGSTINPTHTRPVWQWVALVSGVVLIILAVVLFVMPSDDARRSGLRSKLLTQMGPDVKAGSIEVAGTTTQYLESDTANAGTTVILIHGAGEGAVTWYPVWSRFSKERQVLAPDVIGYGESDKPHAAYDGSYFSDWLLAFLDARGLRQVDLVGSSQGGAIALQFASRHPERVRKLVLVDPAGFGKVPPGILAEMAVLNTAPNLFLAQHSLSYLVANASSVSHAWVAYGLEVLRMPGGKNVFWDGRGNITEPMSSAELERIRMPTLILWGQNDSFFPVSQAYMVQRTLPNATVQILANAGHLPFFDNPKSFSDAVLPFLEPK